MTAQQKLAKQLLTLLQLAEVLGNVSEACRTLEYRRIFGRRCSGGNGGSEAFGQVEETAEKKRRRMNAASLGGFLSWFDSVDEFGGA